MSTQHKPEKLLLDILLAAELIQEFCKELNLHEFQASEIAQAAVERKFEIIGEALNRLKKLSHSLFLTIPQAEKIIGFRNIIAHGYDQIDSEIVWSIIQEDLPELMKMTKELSERQE